MAEFNPDAYASEVPFDPDRFLGGGSSPGSVKAQKPMPRQVVLDAMGRGADRFFGKTPTTAPFDPTSIPKQGLKAAAFLVPGSGLPSMVASGAAYGAGDSDASDLGGIALDALKGGGGGLLVGGALKGGQYLAGKAAPELASLAEKAALRSTYADQAARKAAFGTKNPSPKQIADTGRYLLDSGVPLRSPQSMLEGLQGKMEEVGPKIGNLADQATKAGAKADLEATSLRALQRPDVAMLSKNTELRPIGDRVGAFLKDQIAQHGPEVTPSVLWDIRKQLDPLSKWDKVSPPALSDAFRSVRGTVNRELGSTMDTAGLQDAWIAANKEFSQAAKAAKLAGRGAERRAGNRIVSPYEVLGGLGSAIGVASHSPTAMAAGPAAWLANHYGMPVAARTLDAAAKGARFVGGAETPAAAGAAGEATAPWIQALLDAMQGVGRPSLVRVPAEGAETPTR